MPSPAASSARPSCAARSSTSWPAPGCGSRPRTCRRVDRSSCAVRSSPPSACCGRAAAVWWRRAPATTRSPCRWPPVPSGCRPSPCCPTTYRPARPTGSSPPAGRSSSPALTWRSGPRSRRRSRPSVASTWSTPTRTPTSSPATAPPSPSCLTGWSGPARGPTAVVVPVGGGSLLAGACVAAQARGGVSVVGAEPAAVDSLTQAMRAGHPVSISARPTIADGLRPNRVGALPFRIAHGGCALVARVGEDEIARALRLTLLLTKQLVEPAAATAVAAALRLATRGARAAGPGHRRPTLRWERRAGVGRAAPRALQCARRRAGMSGGWPARRQRVGVFFGGRVPGVRRLLRIGRVRRPASGPRTLRRGGGRDRASRHLARARRGRRGAGPQRSERRAGDPGPAAGARRGRRRRDPAQSDRGLPRPARRSRRERFSAGPFRGVRRAVRRGRRARVGDRDGQADDQAGPDRRRSGRPAVRHGGRVVVAQPAVGSGRRPEGCGHRGS